MFTLLIFGQLHRAIDVDSHLLVGEITPLLVSGVGIVCFCLQTTLNDTLRKNKNFEPNNMQILI